MNSTVWMHYMDADKAFREKLNGNKAFREKLNGNCTRILRAILRNTRSDETEVVRPLNSNLLNHQKTNKSSGTLLKKQIIIIIIMSRRQRGYPWPSLAIPPYHSSPPAGLQGYILCPHIVAVCKFVLVVLLLHIHKWGSTGVHRLWARPCFSSSVPRVWFV